MPARKEYPVPSGKVAQFLTAAIGSASRSQKEISEEIGFGKPQMMTMIKQGKTRLPLDRLPVFAKAIEVDLAVLLRLVLEEYLPNGAQPIMRALAKGSLSENERNLLTVVREASNNRDPAFDTKTLNKFKRIVTGLHA